MRLKTKLVLLITGLVFVMVSLLSSMFLSQLLHQQIEQSFSGNDIVAHLVLFATRRALQDGLKKFPVNPNDPVALEGAVASSLRDDAGLKDLLTSVIQYSPTIFDVSISDWNNRVLLSTDQTLLNELVPARDDYARLREGSLPHLVQAVFGKPKVYDVSLDLKRNDQPFLTVHVGVRTTFLSNTFEPWLVASLTFSGVAILGALVVSAFVANLALQPIEQISVRLDALTQAEAAGEPELPPPAQSGSSIDTVVQVSHKIERLGRRMRNVEEVFSALKENLDQIMSNLEDGILLFTRDARAVLVSDSVQRFLGLSRNEILGLEIHEIFGRDTLLGRTVREAFDLGVSMVQEEITTETGRHIQVSLDFIHDEQPGTHRQSLGALLTLHDLESVREIESELELSRRMAAIGRLTSGVGHEVKNPINAIVVHLELLKNKLEASQDDRAIRHLEVIQSEIQRLDRVVQTLVDFSRPVELQLREQDLREVVSSVLLLASAELETRNVEVISVLPDQPVFSKIDSDLMKQALLNVVLNGGQAMTDGGRLEVRLVEDGRMASIVIRDEGEGIPDEIRQKIFDLYFTTKREGSGIGLAMTYRILQLHNGQVDVESDVGKGTTFILRLPFINSSDLRLRGFLPTGPALSKESRG